MKGTQEMQRLNEEYKKAREKLEYWRKQQTIARYRLLDTEKEIEFLLNKFPELEEGERDEL